MKKGFTLIEMLVVISIIGILASLTLVSYTGAQKQARDSERRSDLNQYRNGLETYAASNDGVYPIQTPAGAASTVCGAELEPDYMSDCPSDPVGDGYVYEYWSADGTDYTLWGGLETTGEYWKICSNGRIGNAPTGSSTCDITD